MEHVFDTLSKKVAGAVSRREAISTLLRGAVGILIVTAGFRRGTAVAQGGACAACGSCETANVSTNTFTSTCKDPCEAQTLCKMAQNNAQYQLLVNTLVNLGFQPSSYDALLFKQGASQTRIFHVTYVDPKDSSNTADLSVGWSPSTGQVNAFAIWSQAGNPIWTYYVNGSSVVQSVPSPPVQLPFAITASPQSMSVAAGSSGTTTITAATSDGFSGAIALKATGLPAGGKASFKPLSIPAPGSGVSIMKISASTTTPIGTFPITVTGTSEGSSSTTTLLLTTTTPSAQTVMPEVLGEFSNVVAPSLEDGPSYDLPETTSACELSCDRFGNETVVWSASLCYDFAVGIAFTTCGLTGPACVVAGVTAYGLAIAACESGAFLTANSICKQVCSCPACESRSLTGACTPTCSADNCLYPNSCDSCNCISPCLAGQVECPAGSTTCCSAGSICCPGSDTCCEQGMICIPASGANTSCCCDPGNTACGCEGGICTCYIG